MWDRFLRIFALTAISALAIVAATIALIDPLAVSPLRIVSDEVLPQTNRRYLLPAIVRSGRFDGYIVGNSTVHSLDPLRLADQLGGTFANLALHGGTPHEQAQVVRLIGAQPRVRTILWGLDSRWCQSAHPDRYNSATEFPEWLYDQNRLNDALFSFNIGTLDLVGRKLERWLWPQGARVRPDGFQNELPPDSIFDVSKARARLYGAEPPRKLLPEQSAAPPEKSAVLGAQLPSVAILRDALSKTPESARIMLVFMPAHANALPLPGSPEDGALQTCKAAIVASVERPGDWVIDAMWRSAWAVDDYNYWDLIHFRDRLAEALISGIGEAVKGDSTSAQSPLRVLKKGAQW
jgi:hypothetical protein